MSDSNPYKGLRPFTEADAGDYFGLDALVERLNDTALRCVPCDGRGTARAMNVGLAAAGHDTVLVTHDPDLAGRATPTIRLADGRKITDTAP